MVAESVGINLEIDSSPHVHMRKGAVQIAGDEAAADEGVRLCGLISDLGIGFPWSDPGRFAKKPVDSAMSLPAEEQNRGAFCTTHWTMVLNAKDPKSPEYVSALQRLCTAYWFPLYALARRKGLGSDDAKDAVQGFFEALLEKEFLNSVERHKGKFRSFLATAFSRFLMNQFAHASRLRRGGGATTFSLNAVEAEERYRYEPQDASSPDKLFDKNWAETVVETALTRLREEYNRVGELPRFELLKANMLGDISGEGYAELGTAIGLSEGGVKTVVRRMRLRFSALLREELLQTLANPDELEAELRYLLQALHNP